MAKSKGKASKEKEAALTFCRIAELVLFDHFDFGNRRIQRFEEQFLQWCDRVQSGDVSIDEVEQILKEEAGVKC